MQIQPWPQIVVWFARGKSAEEATGCEAKSGINGQSRGAMNQDVVASQTVQVGAIN